MLTVVLNQSSDLGKPMSLLKLCGVAPDSMCVCSACGYQVKLKDVHRAVQVHITSAPYDPRDPSNMEAFLQRSLYPKGIFHPTHETMIGAKTCLIRLYGCLEGYMYSELPNVVLERKLQLCKDLLQVMDILAPGLSEERMAFTEEALLTLLEMGRRKQGNKAGVKAAMAQIDGYFAELKLGYVEGLAHPKLQELKKNVDELKASIA